MSLFSGQDAISYLKLYFMIQKKFAKAFSCASHYSELHSIFGVKISSGNFFSDAGEKINRWKAILILRCIIQHLQFYFCKSFLSFVHG